MKFFKSFAFAFFLVLSQINAQFNALNFDGTNNPADYVNCGNSSTLNLTSSLSIAAWVNRNTNFNGDDCIIGKDNYAATTGYSFWIFSDNRFALRLGNRTFLSTNTISTGTWVHLAAIFDASKGIVNIYKNGVLDISHKGVTAPISNTNNLFIGTPQDAVGNNFYSMDGTLDEIRIWNVVRTQTEIQTGMNQEISSGTGLIAAYHCNQGVAGGNNTGVTTLLDASGRNNGTLQSFALNGATSNWVTGAAALRQTLYFNDMTQEAIADGLTAIWTDLPNGIDNICPGNKIASTPIKNLGTNKKFTLQLTVAPGATVNLKSISFKAISNINNGAFGIIVNGQDYNGSLEILSPCPGRLLKGDKAMALTGKVTIDVLFWNSGTGPANFGIDDFVIEGTMTKGQ